ncbi:TIGR04222 domain-containing membrane protein [Phycisphaeraceae bacterium D3-23]
MTMFAMSVLDLPGPKFLMLYGGLLVLSLVLCVLVVVYGPRLDPPPIEVEEEGLDPYDAAYLAGGRARLAEAAVASLVQGGYVRVSLAKWLKAVQPLPDDAPQVERDVYAAAAARGQLKDMRDAVRGAANVIRFRLVEQRLLLSFGWRLAIKAIAGGVYLPVLALGIAKINVGLGRDRPILFLLILCLATVVLMFGPASAVRTSRAGARLLRSMRRATPSWDGRTKVGTGAEQAALACALFGASAVATGGLADMGLFLSPPSSSGGGSGCSDSGCGGGGGGGGCGGCGGCGG